MREEGRAAGMMLLVVGFVEPAKEIKSGNPQQDGNRNINSFL